MGESVVQSLAEVAAPCHGTEAEESRRHECETGRLGHGALTVRAELADPVVAVSVKGAEGEVPRRER